MKKDGYEDQPQRIGALNCNTFLDYSVKDRWPGISPHNRPALMWVFKVYAAGIMRKQFVNRLLAKAQIDIILEQFSGWC